MTTPLLIKYIINGDVIFETQLEIYFPILRENSEQWNSILSRKLRTALHRGKGRKYKRQTVQGGIRDREISQIHQTNNHSVTYLVGPYHHRKLRLLRFHGFIAFHWRAQSPILLSHLTEVTRNPARYNHQPFSTIKPPSPGFARQPFNTL